jgi:hypothetical protein
LGPLRDLVASAVEAEIRLHAAKAEYAVSMAAMACTARRGKPDETRELRRGAAALGVTRQMMQVYAAVGTEWSGAELRVLLEREDCHGNRISVSHLVLLARLPCEERESRTEEVFVRGLNLRDLRRRMGRGSSPDGKPTPRRRPVSNR